VEALELAGATDEAAAGRVPARWTKSSQAISLPATMKSMGWMVPVDSETSAFSGRTSVARYGPFLQVRCSRVSPRHGSRWGAQPSERM